MKIEDYQAKLEERIPGAELIVVYEVDDIPAGLYVAPLEAVISNNFKQLVFSEDMELWLIEVGYFLSFGERVPSPIVEATPIGEEFLSLDPLDRDKVSEFLIKVRMRSIDAEFDQLNFQLENAKEAIRLMKSVVGQSAHQFGDKVLADARPEER